MKLNIFRGYRDMSPAALAEASRYALNHREEASSELLEILEYITRHAEGLSMDSECLIQFPVIYLLAHFREVKAYPFLLRLANMPGELLFDLLGDDVTESYKNLLASVCDGNAAPIQSIIENASLDEYVRAEALNSLLVLFCQRVISRDYLVSYFKQLLNGRLVQDDSFVWEELIIVAAKVHPAELMDDILRVVSENDNLKFVADMEYVREQFHLPAEVVLNDLMNDDDFCFVSKENVEDVLDWVGNLPDEQEEEDDELDDEYGEDEDEIEYSGGNSILSDGFRSVFDGPQKSLPIRKAPEVGRNDPCPCGSGKKYKKCCMGTGSC